MKKFLLLVGLLFPLTSQALTLNVFCITGADADCAAGEAGLTVDVNEESMNRVSFSFMNTTDINGDDAVVTQIYFDDGIAGGVLDEIYSLMQIGTGFVEGFGNPGPPELPGGAPLNFDSEFSVRATAPPPQNGLDSDDELIVFFDIASGSNYDDVIAALVGNELRIGLHVQSFPGSGESASFVTAVPVPAAVWLFGSALGLLVLRSRKSTLV